MRDIIIFFILIQIDTRNAVSSQEKRETVIEKLKSLSPYPDNEMIAKAKACCLDKEFDHEEEPFEKDIGEMYVSLTCVAVVAIVIIVVAKGLFNEYTCKIDNFLSTPTFLPNFLILRNPHVYEYSR